MQKNQTENSPAVGTIKSSSFHKPLLYSTSMIDDAAQLAARIAQGDKKAEAKIVELYEPFMRQILRRRTDSPADIDDLVNQVWLQALPKLREGDLRDFKALPAYLNTFTRRVAQNYYRSPSRTRCLADTEQIEQAVSPWESPYTHIRRAQAYEYALDLMSQLRTERDRTVLKKFLLEEVEKEQLCEELGIDTLQFNKILHRARMRFKKIAQPHLTDLLNTDAMNEPES